MTITSTPSEITYSGDGASTVFNIPFVFDTSADLKVVETAAGVPAVVTTGFSIGGGGGAPGTLTRTPALPVGTNLLVLDNPALTQPVDYADNDAFPAATHERALDRVTRLSKRLNERVERSIRVADGDLIDGDNNLLPLSAVRAGKFMSFDAQGRPTVSSGTGGGDALLRADLAATAVGGDGARLLGYRRTETGSIARSVWALLNHFLLSEDFGVIGNGVADDTAAMQAAFNAAMSSGQVLELQQTGSVSFKLSANLTINQAIHVRGQGYARCQFLSVNTDIITIAAGTQGVTLEGFGLATSVPYTTTPNAVVGINAAGTAASPCVTHLYRDLFFDGMATPMSVPALQNSTLDHITTTIRCKNGILARDKTVDVRLTNSQIYGGLVAGSFGLQIGDAAAAAEAWKVSQNTFYGFDTGLHSNGSQNHDICNNEFDHISNIGIYSDGTVIASTNLQITNNYFAMFGIGTTGIWLRGAAVPSLQNGNGVHNNNIQTYAGKTMTYGILVDGANEVDIITGNRIRATTYDCRVNSCSSALIDLNMWLGAGYYGGAYAVYGDRNVGTIITTQTAKVVASAANITLPDNESVVLISGAVAITSITAARPRGPVTLIFQSTPTVTDGSNLKLAGNFVATADDTITLVCEGTTWYEVARSVN